MRDSLLPYLGQRLTVQANVQAFGWGLGWSSVRERTVLLGHVATPDGQFITDHLWLPVGRRLAALDLRLGDTVQLTARVARYRRCRVTRGKRLWGGFDCQMVYPSRCSIIAPARQEVARPRPPEQAPTNPSRLLAAIGVLWSERGDPPSLARVVDRAGMNPLTVIHYLTKEAKAGRVAFRPDGRVYLANERSR